MLAAAIVGPVGSSAATAQQERRIVFADGDSATVSLMRDDSELVGRCPGSVLQFGIDRRDDEDWTLANRAGWDETALFAVVEEALRRSSDALPGEVPDVCLGLAAAPTDVVLERMRGIGGATMASDLIVLYVAPTLNPELLDALPFTIAHEYHHAVTWGRWDTGLDILIREGRAHHFAWLLYPSHLHPSARALEQGQVEPAWNTIRRALDSPAREFLPTYMFGGGYNGDVVPGWAGYTIGYCIVRVYAERLPELTPAQLARMPPQAFLVDELRCPTAV